MYDVKGIVSSSFMGHFISRQTITNLWVFSTSGTGNALNYIEFMNNNDNFQTTSTAPYYD